MVEAMGGTRLEPKVPVSDVRLGEMPYNSLVVEIPVHFVELPEHLSAAGVLAIDAEIVLCEHTVGVLRIDYEWPGDAVGRPEDFESATTTLIGDVAAPLAKRVLEVVRTKVLPVAQEEGILYADETIAPELLWSSRVLVVDKDASPTMRSFLRGWLSDDLATDSEIDALLEPADRLDAIVRWLKPVYTRASESRVDSLMYCHYLYSALEFHDDRLLQILGAADSADSMRQLRELRGKLEEAAERAQIVLFEHARASRYFLRPDRIEVENILADWHVDKYLVEPVVAKSEQVQKKLQSLGEVRAERSTLGTDVILLFIGVTSILGTLLAVADTGRVEATDPSMADYSPGGESLTGWLSGQATDAILISSMSASVILIVLFIYLRSRSRR
ncbi:MAG: hypothetical protein WAW85_04300 [Gordonia sp. (in: high G+C Gram-positive bacteria)]